MSESSHEVCRVDAVGANGTLLRPALDDAARSLRHLLPGALEVAERPHHTKVRLAEEGFHAPLDLVDGAARVYDPIVRGEAGEDLYGCFLKDYVRAAW